MTSNRPWFVLPVIVVAQFAGTSLWFGGNAVLAGHTGLGAAELTASVQAGFIAGTLLFALLSLPDRFAPPRLFFICAVMGGLANALIPFVLEEHAYLVYPLRVATGFFLAGIYPVGMKVAADWYPEGLGSAMGWLVGALVLGTAFPHFLRAGLHTAAPEVMLWLLSVVAAAGGVLLYLLLPAKSGMRPLSGIRLGAAGEIWREKNFRKAALGYLGHMWELYTFWAFVPVLVKWLQEDKSLLADESAVSFSVIGMGAVGCIGGGMLSGKLGSRLVARTALCVSGMACLCLPFAPQFPQLFILIFLLLWGTAAAADSPQLTALAAQSAPPHLKGTALTLLTSAGFALTVFSLLLMQYLAAQFGPAALLLLAPGPLLGAIALGRGGRLSK